MAYRGTNFVILSILFFLLLTKFSYSQIEKLFQGQILKDGDELVSAYGTFRLGFYSPNHNTNRYLGIWYYRPTDTLTNRLYGFQQDNNRPVWIANRNIPVLDKSGRLTIDSRDGNLKILHSGGKPIEITSIQAEGNTSASLLKTGNLLLYEINSDGSIRRELWQSFDYPTDTLLPGMKLGINLKTGHQWFLQSWITDESPAQGSFTLGIDTNVSGQLIVRWRGDPYCSCGIPLKEQFNYEYNFSYISNEQEKYLNYSADEKFTSFPILRITDTGSVLDGLPVFCRELQGSVYPNPPICRRDFSYFQVKFGFMSEDGFKFKESDNMTLADCEAKCFKNCSCVAYATINKNNNTGCEIWSRGTKFIESSEPDYRSISMEMKPKEMKWWLWLIIALVLALMAILLGSLFYLTRRKYKGKEEKRWMSLAIAVGAVLLIPLLFYLTYFVWRKLRAKVESIINRKKLLRELGDNVSLPTSYGNEKTEERDQNSMKHELKIFDFPTIAAATNNFSTTNKLGEGGFGPVYKGQLINGKEIAIKRLSRRSGQGILEFKNEAKLIAKLQHTNLARLLGCSLQGDERLLVYEYMPNKSLDFFIFDSNRKTLLNWEKRFTIIEGIAQGLVYLHKYSRLRVIHRDLKAGNILLDDQMNPKISDFGMARIFSLNESEANTNRVVGTYGYMSPEYAMSGVVSIKTDVFSFGVLVLEIVSGKKNHSCYNTESPLNLVGYAWKMWNEGKGLELTDSSLEGSCPQNEVLRCIHVGLLCVQDQAMDRPTMSDVVSMLTNETILLPKPKQPAFFIDVRTEEPEEGAENMSENCSINNVTISVMEAR